VCAATLLPVGVDYINEPVLWHTTRFMRIDRAQSGNSVGNRADLRQHSGIMIGFAGIRSLSGGQVFLN
jgi:hypothetical protein